jgi:plasmid maintenance system antidote protein VapI
MDERKPVAAQIVDGEEVAGVAREDLDPLGGAGGEEAAAMPLGEAARDPVVGLGLDRPVKRDRRAARQNGGPVDAADAVAEVFNQRLHDAKIASNAIPNATPEMVTGGEVRHNILCLLREMKNTVLIGRASVARENPMLSVTPAAPPKVGAVMPPSYITRRLRERDANGRELARHMEWTPSTLSRVVRGKRDLTLDELTRMAKFLAVTPEELFRRLAAPAGTLAEEPAGGPASMPIAGFIGPGGVVAAEFPQGAAPEARRLKAMTATLRIPDLSTAGLVFLSVVRTQRYEPGDLLYCEPTALAQAVGRECVVTLETGERALRRIIGPGKRRGTFALFSRDDARPYEAVVTAAAVVKTIRVLALNSGH